MSGTKSDGVWVLYYYDAGPPIAHQIFFSVNDCVRAHEQGYDIAFWYYEMTLADSIKKWQAEEQ